MNQNEKVDKAVDKVVSRHKKDILNKTLVEVMAEVMVELISIEMEELLTSIENNKKEVKEK